MKWSRAVSKRDAVILAVAVPGFGIKIQCVLFAETKSLHTVRQAPQLYCAPPRFMVDCNVPVISSYSVV